MCICDFKASMRRLGGWWYEHNVPDRIKADLSLLNDSLPKMVPYRLFRRKLSVMPDWARAFFSERQ